MSPMIKEMQINTTMRYLWNSRLANTKKNGNTKAGTDQGKKQTLSQFEKKQTVNLSNPPGG